MVVKEQNKEGTEIKDPVRGKPMGVLSCEGGISSFCSLPNSNSLQSAACVPEDENSAGENRTVHGDALTAAVGTAVCAVMHSCWFP